MVTESFCVSPTHSCLFSVMVMMPGWWSGSCEFKPQRSFSVIYLLELNEFFNLNRKYSSRLHTLSIPVMRTDTAIRMWIQNPVTLCSLQDQKNGIVSFLSILWIFWFWYTHPLSLVYPNHPRNWLFSPEVLSSNVFDVPHLGTPSPPLQKSYTPDADKLTPFSRNLEFWLDDKALHVGCSPVRGTIYQPFLVAPHTWRQEIGPSHRLWALTSWWVSTHGWCLSPWYTVPTLPGPPLSWRRATGSFRREPRALTYW